MGEIEEKTRKYLEGAYKSLLLDLIDELGQLLDNLLSDGTPLGITLKDGDSMIDIASDSLFGKLEDLPGYLTAYGAFSDIAAWRLKNPEASTAEVLNMAFAGNPESNEDAILDSLFAELTLDNRIAALTAASAKAAALEELFNIYGMDKEREVAQVIKVELPEQIYGWDF